MIIKEIRRNFHNNRTAEITLVCQIAIFFVLVGTFMAFSGELHNGKSELERFYDNRAIYHILDGYFDPDAFTAVREQEDTLVKLKDFYNGLNHAKSFDYLAMFNQSIYILDNLNRFPEAPKLENGRNNDGNWKRVDAFQVNNQVVNYFELSAANGRVFVEEDFKNVSDEIPVLIGGDLSEKFDVGDRIHAQHYQKEVVLIVVGILERDTFIYFNGNHEFYLDRYIVMPYLDYHEPKTAFEEWFQEVVYFAMIHGYLSINLSENTEKDMMMEVEAISQKSNFDNYLFIGSNPNIQPYKGLINIINENFTIILIMFFLFFCVNIITVCFRLLEIENQRLPAFAIHYLNGASIFDLSKYFLAEIFLLGGMAWAISVFVLDIVLKIVDIRTIFLLTGIAFGLIISVSIPPVLALRKIDLIAILSKEEGLF